MLFTPLKGNLLYEDNTGDVGLTTLGTSVTTGGASNTKGAATQLILATSFDAYWVEIFASNYASSAAASDGCLDIMVGGVGSERVLIPDLLMGYAGDTTISRWGKSWAFPLYIPSGTRLSARAAGLRTTTAMRVMIALHGGNGYAGFPVGTKVVTYGIGTVPNGTSITAGASGVEGAWTQLAAATSEDHIALVSSFQMTNITTASQRVVQMDIGIGAAAAEREISKRWWFMTEGSEIVNNVPRLPTFAPIPSGSRLSARLSCSNTAQAYDVAVHAVCP